MNKTFSQGEVNVYNSAHGATIYTGSNFNYFNTATRLNNLLVVHTSGYSRYLPDAKSDETSQYLHISCGCYVDTSQGERDLLCNHHYWLLSI